jgi:hypothetical protein
MRYQNQKKPYENYNSPFFTHYNSSLFNIIKKKVFCNPTEREKPGFYWNVGTSNYFSHKGTQARQAGTKKDLACPEIPNSKQRGVLRTYFIKAKNNCSHFRVPGMLFKRGFKN